MKKLLILLFISILTVPSELNAESSNGFQAIKLIINSETTQEDLERMQQFMQDNGYDLSIEEITFDADGKIEAISGKVDFGKSSGSFGSDKLGENSIVIKKSLFNKMSIEIMPLPKC